MSKQVREPLTEAIGTEHPNVTDAKMCSPCCPWIYTFSVNHQLNDLFCVWLCLITCFFYKALIYWMVILIYVYLW